MIHAGSDMKFELIVQGMALQGKVSFGGGYDIKAVHFEWISDYSMYILHNYLGPKHHLH